MRPSPEPRATEFVERTGLSEPAVAARLRELNQEEQLSDYPCREPGQRARSGYRLTEKGGELLPVLVAMMRWGDRWLFPDGARVEVTHSGCGSPVHALLRASTATPSPPTGSI